MNAPSHRNNTILHHPEGFWPASTLRVVCLDEHDIDTNISNLQKLFPSDSFSLITSDTASISQDSLMTPFELDACSHTNTRAVSSGETIHSIKIPASIIILSSLPTPVKSNTTKKKTHKRNKKLRGGCFFDDWLSSDLSSLDDANYQPDNVPVSSPFHLLFPIDVEGNKHRRSRKIGVIPLPLENRHV